MEDNDALDVVLTCVALVAAAMSLPGGRPEAITRRATEFKAYLGESLPQEED